MKVARRLIVAATAALVFWPAAGQSQVFFDNVCTPGSFKVCASAKTYIDAAGKLVIEVWNENQATTSWANAMAAYNTANGGHHTITSIALTGLSSFTAINPTLLGQYVASNGTVSTLTKWVFGANDLQQKLSFTAASTQGHKEGIVGCFDPGTPNQGHVATCNSSFNNALVRFTISGFSGLTNASLQGGAFEYHTQQVADPNCQPGSADDNCLTLASLKAEGLPPTVTPEPMSIVLLGTGLVGVGLVSRRRRNSRRSE
jgi:hypothetical protein